jgi:alpha-galactosidase
LRSFLVCVWSDLIYGLDPTHPASATYVESVVELLAEWELDFVKVDCIFGTRDLRVADIKMWSQAVAKYPGLTLSLSPGVDATVEQAELVEDLGVAAAYRVTDDLHDFWPDVSATGLFSKLAVAANFQSHFGHAGFQYPDLDMLAIGTFANPPMIAETERKTHFTPAEQQLMLTLWCITASPLIFGGVVPTDNDTLALLTNEEVLKMHATALSPKQIYSNADGTIAWSADCENQQQFCKYVALFNTAESAQVVSISWSQLSSSAETCEVRDLWQKSDLGTFSSSYGRTIDIHGSALLEVFC